MCSWLSNALSAGNQEIFRQRVEVILRSTTYMNKGDHWSLVIGLGGTRGRVCWPTAGQITLVNSFAEAGNDCPVDYLLEAIIQHKCRNRIKTHSKNPCSHGKCRPTSDLISQFKSVKSLFTFRLLNIIELKKFESTPTMLIWLRRCMWELRNRGRPDIYCWNYVSVKFKAYQQTMPSKIRVK